MNKPFAESCEQNKQVIFDVIQPLLSDSTSVLEVGSGTGQHAVFFAKQLAHLNWYTSDLLDNHEGIKAWLNDDTAKNIFGPYAFNALTDEVPSTEFDSVFTANTLHIMSWRAVELLIDKIGQRLPAGGKLIIYGPFNYNNQFTSESNQRFDLWLKERDPESGVRNFEDVIKLAELQNIYLEHDYEMPVNNRILYLRKKA